jgi:molybdate transport system substrate-binding protein
MNITIGQHDTAMIRFRPFLFAALMLLSGHAAAEKFTIAADLKFAMDEIITRYKQDHPADMPQVIHGSSGKFHTHIQHNAPYDLYFSADIAYLRQLEQAGFAASPVRPYALGRIVLWSASIDARKLTLASLSAPAIRRVAIANPRHAPYGKRAGRHHRAGAHEGGQTVLEIDGQILRVAGVLGAPGTPVRPRIEPET